jgi:hypothetical protein
VLAVNGLAVLDVANVPAACIANTVAYWLQLQGTGFGSVLDLVRVHVNESSIAQMCTLQGRSTLIFGTSSRNGYVWVSVGDRVSSRMAYSIDTLLVPVIISSAVDAATGALPLVASTRGTTVARLSGSGFHPNSVVTLQYVGNDARVGVVLQGTRTCDAVVDSGRSLVSIARGCRETVAICGARSWPVVVNDELRPSKCVDCRCQQYRGRRRRSAANLGWQYYHHGILIWALAGAC